eukprot:248318-Chlamydomonas_euryale.AAC.1
MQAVEAFIWAAAPGIHIHGLWALFRACHKLKYLQKEACMEKYYAFEPGCKHTVQGHSGRKGGHES